MVIRNAVAPFVAMLRLKRGLCSLGRLGAVADLIDHRRDRQYLPMSTPSGLAGTIREVGAPSSSTVSSPQ
jgi:hypothetical protein